MTVCRSTDFELICAKDPIGVCYELAQHTVYNADGSIGAIYYTELSTPLTPLDTTGWTVTGSAPCKSLREPHSVCLDGVQIAVFKLTDCAGVVTWVREFEKEYIPTGKEIPGAPHPDQKMLEKGYDVVGEGTPTQSCVEIEIIKTAKCDGTLLLQYFKTNGTPYALAGSVKFDCPCVSKSLGVITSFSALAGLS